jgi:hypothetical protein
MSIISGITTTGNIVPDLDGDVDLGTPTKRFRQINTLSGDSSYWKSTTISATTISATTINLGLDSSSNTRILNANTSILKNDCLEGGLY